ncbi:hypothetical protein [Spirosoma oryzicola]|uniref:hypothetical protein n=1 Tax=Spirosoma oryzicola TaxID=2898794 RepID=UPI001E3089FA|nr:hypothetical protein [Spirosoma oryzicola]UHG94137.1 hypothetical protein LQ777_25715 [Spirosoma oryzicola]
MEDEKEDRFRRLIQKAGHEKIGTDFTRAIMKRLQAESERDSATEAALIQLFGSHTLVEKPSVDFSRRVMNQITVSQPKPLEPIIRPSVWYSIAASVLLIVFFCILLLPSNSTEHQSSGLDRFLSGFEGTLDALPVSYPLTIVALSVLMVSDYFLRRKLTINY